MEKMNLFSEQESITADAQSVTERLNILFNFLLACQNNTAEYSDNVMKNLDDVISESDDSELKQKLLKIKKVIANRLATKLILIDLNINELTTLDNFLNSFE